MQVTTSGAIAVAAVSIPLVFGAPAIASADTVPVPRVREHNTVRASGTHVSVVVNRVPGQAYFWTNYWQKGEAAADSDLRAGDFKEFDDAEDAVKWLFGKSA